MSDFARPVVETLHASGLDPEQFVVMGGGALALHGMREAHDVDLLVNPGLFRELVEAGQTPAGIPLEHKDAGILDFRLLTPKPDTGGRLRLDLNSISGYGNYRRFGEYREAAEIYEHSGLRICFTSLTNLLVEKAHSWRPKDRRDARRIRKLLAAAA
ncbi:MAG TPA: hypothetical protein VMU97_00635 [Candidatus Dormibacteraeota bacterium]|nr:hypothetical protein [Candidatus Dormibacteraeota bacterium]